MAAPKKSPSSPPKKTTAAPATPKSAPAPIAQAVAPSAMPVASVAPAAKSGNGSPASPKKVRVVTHEDIKKRAYEIYVSRGYGAGDPNADWAEAERQLKNEM